MTPALIKENLKGMEDLATAIVVCDKELIIKYINKIIVMVLLDLEVGLA